MLYQDKRTPKLPHYEARFVRGRWLVVEPYRIWIVKECKTEQEAHDSIAEAKAKGLCI